MGKHWNVVDEAAGIWFWVYNFNNNPINTTAIRLDDGKLMVVSPGIDPTPEVFAELEELGTVAALVSPGALHHMGFPAWQKQYPDVPFYCTTSGVDHIPGQHKDCTFQLNGLDALREILPSHIAVDESPGKHGDMLMKIDCGDAGLTWLSNEILSNNADLPTNIAFRLLFKWTGSGPGLAIIKPVIWLIGAKKADLKAFYMAELDANPLQRLMPCHGDVLAGDDVADRVRALLNKSL